MLKVFTTVWRQKSAPANLASQSKLHKLKHELALWTDFVRFALGQCKLALVVFLDCSQAQTQCLAVPELWKPEWADSKSYKIWPAMMECCQAKLKIALQGSLARWQFQNDVKCVGNNCDCDVDSDCDCAAYSDECTVFAYLLLFGDIILGFTNNNRGCL